MGLPSVLNSVRACLWLYSLLSPPIPPSPSLDAVAQPHSFLFVVMALLYGPESFAPSSLVNSPRLSCRPACAARCSLPSSDTTSGTQYVTKIHHSVGGSWWRGLPRPSRCGRLPACRGVVCSGVHRCATGPVCASVVWRPPRQCGCASAWPRGTHRVWALRAPTSHGAGTVCTNL